MGLESQVRLSYITSQMPAYLRLVNKSGQVHCSFVMGKARVTPRKNVTVPHLELTAALVSTITSSVLRARARL